MNSIKISIIVPIYNAEKYLHRCLDSIESQSFKNFEVLLIDDGSTDHSFEICKEYAEKDKRFQAMHKTNEGVGAARKYGIDHACGEYTIHVDPDDWIEPEMLEHLYEKAYNEEADIVICDFQKDFCDHQELLLQKPISLDKEEIIGELIRGSLHGSVCNKLIRLGLYKNSGVNFIKGMNSCEDLYVCVSLLSKNKNVKIGYINECLYHYDQYSNSNSLTKNLEYRRSKMLGSIQFINLAEKIVDKNIFEDDFFVSKSNMLNVAFYEKTLTQDEFLQLGWDIKKRYIHEKGLWKNRSVIEECIKLSLRGHYDLAQKIFSCYLHFKGIKRI